MVKPGDIVNRGESIIRGAAEVLADMKHVKAGPDAETAPAHTPPAPPPRTTEERIVLARELRAPKGIEDPRSWYMGRDAAIFAIAGE